MRWIGTTTNGNYIIELSPSHWQALAENGVGYGENISSVIKEYRTNNGLTQLQMAKRINVSRTYYSMIERGVAGNYSHAVYKKIIAEISKVGT